MPGIATTRNITGDKKIATKSIKLPFKSLQHIFHNFPKEQTFDIYDEPWISRSLSYLHTYLKIVVMTAEVGRDVVLVEKGEQLVDEALGWSVLTDTEDWIMTGHYQVFGTKNDAPEHRRQNSRNLVMNI